MENPKNPTTENKPKVKLYLAIPQTLQRIHVLRHFLTLDADPLRQAMVDACELAIEQWVKDYLPSGSGFDAGTSLTTTPGPHMPRLVFETAFHHMDGAGGYAGWTHHRVIVRPDWDGFKLAVSGSDRGDIKDYIEDCFYHALNQEVQLP